MTTANNRRAATAIGMVVALLLGPVQPMLKASHAAGAEESVCPPPGAVPTNVFADDDDHIHESAINCAAQYDLVGGFDGGAYGPDASITRAQMASMLVRLLDLAGVDLPAASNAPDVFHDDDGSIHESNINVLAALGVARGVGPATFAPNRSLSRAQLASLVVQALEKLLEERLDRSTDAFDDDEGSVHEGAINALAAAGVVHGVAGRRFAPDAHVTRGQTASFVIGSAAMLHDHGRWPPTHGASVVLDHRTVTADSAITGAVLGGEMTGAHVSGCGLQRQALHDRDGARAGLQFEATVPAVQPAGDCVLTFVVSFRQAPNHAVEETITVAAPVTAAGDSGDSGDSGSGDSGSGGDTSPAATIAPTLASCRRTGQRSTADSDYELVVFQFDQDVTGAAPAPDKFHLYHHEIQNFNAANAVASGNHVRAEFPVGVVNGATLCTVDRGAVTAESGVVNPIGDAGIDPTTHQALATVPPDLEAVGNLRTDVVGRIYADFTFDEDVHNQPAARRFKLISTDGSTFRGQALFAPTEALGQTPFTPPGNVISVQFAATHVQLPLSQVARGVVEEDTVCDARPLCNALQVADVRLAGITNAPDLVSAQIMSGGGSAAFTFDEPVAPLDQQDDDFDATRFGIYDGSGAWNTGYWARPSETDPRVVHVSFGYPPGAAPSDRGDGAASGQVPRDFPVPDGVGAFVFDDAVAKSNSELAVRNGDDEVPLERFEGTPGRTWGADLIAAATFTDASGDTVVRYTFDGTPPSGDWDALVCEDFALYDLAGTEFVPLPKDGEPCRLGPADSTAAIREVADDRYSADVYGFPEGSVDAAVRAAVHDSVIGGGSNPNAARMRFPEGAEPLSRG